MILFSPHNLRYLAWWGFAVLASLASAADLRFPACFTLASLLLPATMLFGASQPELPPDNHYVVVQDGHLSVDGKRERYWSVIGKPFIAAGVQLTDDQATREAKVAKARKGTDLLVKRFSDLGFNSVRLWDVVPDTEDYTPGDGSRADGVDYFIFKAKEAGFRIWTAGFGNRVGSASPESVDIIQDPKTAEAWKTAVTEYANAKKLVTLRNSFARVWDPRLEAIYIERMKKNADHLNKHTGLRWADDPVFAVWELANEEWWMRRMLGGGWAKEPEFFRSELVARWNTWLLKKYGTTAKIQTAWKKLLPGESLEKQSLLLVPMAGKSDPSLSMNDANPVAREALMGMEQSYSRADFASERASDVLAFLLELQLAHKQRCAAAVKTFGKSCKLSPTIFDTGIGYEIQSQFLHQSADAVAHDAYVNGWGPEYKEPDPSSAKNENRKMLAQAGAERISANTGPWVNWLLKPPGISQGVPWLEHNKVEGKPYLVYETQIQQPAKYRADFPLRIAALASIQDWDWIAWHYFSPSDDVGTKERPFDRPLDVTTGDHPQGYHFTYDEVQNAMMRQAALIWRNQNLSPPESPTRFIYGRNSLTAADSMDYAGSYGTTGFDMLQTTYQYGVRIEIDPNREQDEVIGPVVKFADRHTHNPYTPTPAIVFDWKKGFLMFDDPESVAFTGLLAHYGEEVKFKNGVVLKDVRISNPPGIFSPVTEDEKYIAFSLTSEDGKPLAETQKASLSLVSTSFNTGFTLDAEKTLASGKPKGAVTAGTLPVLVARVGATIEAQALNGMKYTFRDWDMQEIGSGVITSGTLAIPENLPIFCVELRR